MCVRDADAATFRGDGVGELVERHARNRDRADGVAGCGGRGLLRGVGDYRRGGDDRQAGDANDDRSVQPSGAGHAGYFGTAACGFLGMLSRCCNCGLGVGVREPVEHLLGNAPA